MTKGVFISYSWTDIEIANKIDDDWKSVGITLKRDIRDLSYKMDIKSFMDQVRNIDFVILVISENYLKSEACMYEALEMLESASFKERVLPIIVNGSNIFDSSARLNYILYWQNKLTELNDLLKSKLGYLSSGISLIEKTSHYQRIVKDIDKLLSNISGMLCVSWEKTQQNFYEDIFKHIGLETHDILEDCIRIYNIKDKEEQEIEIEEIALKYPNNKYLLFLKAKIAKKQQKYKVSGTFFEKLNNNYPSFGGLHSEYADLLSKHLNNPEKAKFHYLQSLETDPNDETSLYSLALVYYKNDGNFIAAKSYLEKFIHLNPSSAEAYNFLGLLYVKLQNNQLAESNFLKAIEMDSSQSSALTNIAVSNRPSTYFR